MSKDPSVSKDYSNKQKSWTYPELVEEGSAVWSISSKSTRVSEGWRRPLREKTMTSRRSAANQKHRVQVVKTKMANCRKLPGNDMGSQAGGGSEAEKPRDVVPASSAT